MYEIYVKRIVIEELEAERRAQVRSIYANSAYLKTDKALEVRVESIAALNQHFDEAVEHVRDPGKKEREDRAFRENPLFAAGMRGLDRLKWDLGGNVEMQQQLAAQGL